MGFLGLLFLIAVDLVACAALTVLAFRVIQKVEKRLLKDAAESKPGLAVLLGQAAVGLTIMTISVGAVAAFEVESLLDTGRGERSPIHSIIGRDGVGFFQSVSAIALLGLPVAMLGSVMLGICGAVGGLRSQNRRATLYGVASLIINGLIVVLSCWIFSAALFRGGSDPDPEEEQSRVSSGPRCLLMARFSEDLTAGAAKQTMSQQSVRARAVVGC